MDKHAVIVTTNFLPKSINYGCLVGIEQGAQYCVDNSIDMDFAIGDFDSVSKDDLKKIRNKTKVIKLPVSKNETDLEAAIIELKNAGYEKITVYTGGPRWDHFLNQVQTANKYNVEIIDANNSVSLLKEGEYQLVKSEYKYISFFSFNESLISVSGVKYPINSESISFNDLKYISNEFVDDLVKITVHQGSILCIQAKD